MANQVYVESVDTEPIGEFALGRLQSALEDFGINPLDECGNVYGHIAPMALIIGAGLGGGD